MTQTIDLSGRTAIVTGGCRGIGRATSVLLAEHGARVFVVDVVDVEDDDQDTHDQLGITFLRCDVRHESELADVINTVVTTTGRLDILVSNAGIGMVKPVEAVTEKDWDACIDTNLKGAFFGAKHALPPMRKAGGGAIVNISSNAGLLPRAHDPVYSISKLALVGLTRSLGLCLAPDRIRVNAVCPGPVGNTAMMDTDLADAADPDALKRQIVRVGF